MPAWTKDFYLHRGAGGVGRGPLYGNFESQGALGSLQKASDTLFASAFIMPSAGAIDQVLFQVTGAGSNGSKCRVAIYSNQRDDTMYPSKLMFDTGEQDGTAVGVKTILPVATPGYQGFFLDSGLYWFVYYCGLTGQQPFVASLAQTMPFTVFGMNSTPLPINEISLSLTYVAGAAMPSTFPAVGTAGALPQYAVSLPCWSAFRLAA